MFARQPRFLLPLSLVILSVLAACSDAPTSAVVGSDRLEVLTDMPALEPLALTATPLYAQLDDATNIAAGGGFNAGQYVADDFVVPAGETWLVSEVGFVSGGRAVFTPYRVAFFTANPTDPHLPGDLISEHPYAYDDTFERDGLRMVPLPESVRLSAGTYWVGVDGWLVQARTPPTANMGARGSSGSFETLTTPFTTDPLDFVFALFADTTSPSVTLTTPEDGVNYEQGEVVLVDYSCADTGSGIDACTGTLASGAALDTGTPGSYSFTAEARDRAGNPASVTHRYTVVAPVTPDSYTVDLESAPGNRTLWSVRVGRGVTYRGDGSANPDIVRINGQRFVNGKLRGGNQVKVLDLYGSKRLTLVRAGTNSPYPNGGAIEIKPFRTFGGPSAGKNGLVTLKSLTLSNITSDGAYLTLYGNGVFIKRIPLAQTGAGQSRVIPLDEPGVGFIRVTAGSAFAVDDVVFESSAGE